MKFYLDFEAAQYTERITSIGCICENGKMFKTYVKLPEGEKVGKEVAALTHLTTDFLNEHGITADEAFKGFYAWVREQGNDTPIYYVYGDSDKHFIEQTMKKMSSLTALTFASSIIYFMKDYSNTVKEHYGVRLGLNKLYNLMKQEENEQKHDALEDAVMLSYIAENLDKISIEMPVETVRKKEKKIEDKAWKNRKNKILNYYHKWEKRKRHHTMKTTDGNENDWSYCVYHISANKQRDKFYFKDFDMLVAWAIKFNFSGYAITKTNDIVKAINTLYEIMDSENHILDNYYYIKNKENQ